MATVLGRMLRSRQALLAESNINATSLTIYERMVLVAHRIIHHDRTQQGDRIDQFQRRKVSTTCARPGRVGAEGDCIRGGSRLLHGA